MQSELTYRMNFIGIYIALNKFDCPYTQKTGFEVKIQVSSKNIYSGSIWEGSVLDSVLGLQKCKPSWSSESIGGNQSCELQLKLISITQNVLSL